MPVSKPLQLISIRLSPDEKARLEELAREREVTLSHAFREGVRLYLSDWSAAVDPDPTKVRLRAP